MKKQIEEKVPCLVIYQNMGNRQNFITGTAQGAVRLPHYHTDKEKAKPFVDQKEVDAFIVGLHNPQGKRFLTAGHMVMASELEPVKLPQGVRA